MGEAIAHINFLWHAGKIHRDVKDGNYYFLNKMKINKIKYTSLWREKNKILIIDQRNLPFLLL